MRRFKVILLFRAFHRDLGILAATYGGTRLIITFIHCHFLTRLDDQKIYLLHRKTVSSLCEPSVECQSNSYSIHSQPQTPFYREMSLVAIIQPGARKDITSMFFSYSFQQCLCISILSLRSNKVFGTIDEYSDFQSSQIFVLSRLYRDVIC
jgi:hypothetical protein